MDLQSTNSVDQAIHNTVSDYFGGWYEANVERISRSLHEGLAKRAIKRDEKGKAYLHKLTKEQMVEKTREGGGSDSLPDKRHWTITILDRYEEIATVKVSSPEYVEYVHVAMQGGQWLIINTLYANMREEAQE